MTCKRCGRPTNPEVTGSICEGCWEAASSEDLDTIASPASTSDPVTWRHAASHPALAADLARRLVWVEDHDTLVALAANANTPPEVLAQLERHPNPVLASLARTPRPSTTDTDPATDPEATMSAVVLAPPNPDGDNGRGHRLPFTPKRWMIAAVAAGSILLIGIFAAGASSNQPAPPTTSTTLTTTTTTEAPTTTMLDLEVRAEVLGTPTGPMTDSGYGAIAQAGDEVTAPKVPFPYERGTDSWQWEECDPDGSCTDIADATDRIWTIPGDLGSDRVRVRLTIRPEHQDGTITAWSKKLTVIP